MANFWERLFGRVKSPAADRSEPPASDRVAAVLAEMRARAPPRRGGGGGGGG
jgi:hypothetical protein